MSVLPEERGYSVRSPTFLSSNVQRPGGRSVSPPVVHPALESEVRAVAYLKACIDCAELERELCNRESRIVAEYGFCSTGRTKEWLDYRIDAINDGLDFLEWALRAALRDGPNCN